MAPVARPKVDPIWKIQDWTDWLAPQSNLRVPVTPREDADRQTQDQDSDHRHRRSRPGCLCDFQHPQRRRSSQSWPEGRRHQRSASVNQLTKRKTSDGSSRIQTQITSDLGGSSVGDSTSTRRKSCCLQGGNQITFPFFEFSC